MPYSYLLNKVFNQFVVIGTKGTPEIAEKISLTTLVENGCIEGKIGIVSNMLKLLDSQECVTKEMPQLKVVLDINETKIMHLKLQNQNLFSEGLIATEESAVQNQKFIEKLQY